MKPAIFLSPPNLFNAVVARDGNSHYNRFRLERPGKLGGLVGDVLQLAIETGSVTLGARLNPIFAEKFMVFPESYTRFFNLRSW
ncbi:hypothetical protein ACI1IZ_003201 [Vibrio parahaemolyticus]